ncbi:MAG: right-handed parallel beta-helix repeat-containing protein [Phycisphaerales bacterium]|nr:right-handed parallel beta-helix repeat-containing protein [Phycisphaerales bacterium]
MPITSPEMLQYGPNAGSSGEDDGEPDNHDQFRSVAHLRLAQSYLAEGNDVAARVEYDKIREESSYPAVHRYEAGEVANEIDRRRQGLPERDPLASRTLIPPVESFAAEVFVSPTGNDAHDGSAARPLATLHAARDKVRAIKAAGVTGPVVVRILPGVYQMTETLELNKRDSGTENAPVVYRAEEKGRAVLYGGRRLSGFAPVTDPAVLERLPESAADHVLQCDLTALGIFDYGELRVRGIGQPPAPPTLELYVNGAPMTLARWPNEGFVEIRKLIEPGSRETGTPSVFEYDSDRHARWTQATDLWLFGYFHFLWADATIKVDRIDPAARTITTAEPYHYGGRGMDTRQPIIYYAFNLIEELDQPGEWYLDRDTGILYLYPPCDPARMTAEIGMLSVPMVTMNNVDHLHMEGLVFDLARDNGLTLGNCRHCLLAGCTVTRMAGNGITIRDGRHSGILGCDVHTIGRRATEVIGGDRETLTPAGHFVENCRIYDFGRIDRTYTPGIQLEGVGNRVAHNRLYDSPSSVMRVEGNDHLIEFNEVHSAVRESDDQGAIDLFGNPTFRGVVFRYNSFHHVGKTGTEAAVHGQAAIRFDDIISGMLVYGNVFFHSSNGYFGAVQIHCGRDNVIDNNIFVDCALGISRGWCSDNKFWHMIRAGNAPASFYTNELYLSRYPELAIMMEEPGINHVWRNVFFRTDRVVTGTIDWFDMLGNGVFEDDPGFVKAEAGDLRLQPDASLFNSVAFRPIPVERIGLYEDAYRATWPVHAEPVTVRE